MHVAHELEKLHERICAILDCEPDGVVLTGTVEGLLALRTFDVPQARPWARHASLVGSREQLLDWARRARGAP